MKVTWESKDIYPNRKIYNAGYDSKYIIGVLSFDITRPYYLIDLIGGTVIHTGTPWETACYLNANTFMPEEFR